MPMKLLRRSDRAMVRLLFPDTYDEYVSVFDALGRPIQRIRPYADPSRLRPRGRWRGLPTS